MKHVAADDNDLMDLVNEKDEVIGTIYQHDAASLIESKEGFVRGTAAFIQNDEGKLWIPRRSADKRVAPNGLDFSVAEHVQSGETYKDGVIRGFKEELLLDISPDDLILLGKSEPIEELPFFFMEVFLYKADVVKSYNHEDYSGFEWLTPKEVIERIDNGELSKSALRPMTKAFFKDRT